MLFIKSSTMKPRGTRAFHIVLEEAHRYVQHDSDIDLLGYNIFERIAKEGRKYGIFLVLITQRPSELSDTCVSQCANFIILRTMHPVDLKYIREMVPNVTNEIVLQMKNLKPGNAIAFGSAFKVPTVLYIDLPDPMPLSNNIDLESVWYEKEKPTEHLEQKEQFGSTSDVSSMMTQQASQQNFIQPQQPVAQPQEFQNVQQQSLQQPQAVPQPRFIQSQPLEMANNQLI